MIRNPFRFYDVPPPPPTYFGGTLPEVMVSSDEVPYPYYNQLTPEERSFFNDEGPIGRGVRSIANTGKRGQTANELRDIAGRIGNFIGENTGVLGTARFLNEPIKKLKGAGRTIEATILGSSPFITSPYNQEDVADTFDALDAFGVVTAAFAPFKTPLQQGIKSSGRYLTQGPLRNAWILNPKAYQYNLPENTMWRGLGKEGMEDAVSSGLFRSKQNVVPYKIPGTNFRISKSFGTNPYFTPKFKTAATYGDNFIAEVPRDVANWRNRYGRNTWSQIADGPIPIDEGRILQKDWWKGYKPINTPKQLPGSGKFKSEIDWSKWNPETPKYPELIDEYNAIEESTKKAGTWMKNVDGSAFKGTPEQFIQQQSSYFKKAFPNPVRERRPDFFSDEILGGQDPKNYFDENMPIQYNYHSSPNKFDFFDENLFSTGGFGKGIYTSRIPQNMYGKNQYQLYLNANNPQPYSYTRFVTKNGSEVAERVNAPKLVHEKTFYQQLEPGRDYFNPAEEASQSLVPFSNYPKSAVGNVGFFDMTNPNIYKSMMPLGAIYGGRNYYRDK